MKPPHHILIAAAVNAAFALLAPAQAQGNHDDHHGATAVKVAANAAKADMTEGEVRKIDKEGKRITIKHGEIKNLDMPAMTMVFQASNPAMLDKVKVGDKIRFVAANPGGKLTVTAIEPAK